MSFKWTIHESSSESSCSSGKEQRKSSGTSTTLPEHMLRLNLERTGPTKRTDEWLKNTKTPENKDKLFNVFNVKTGKIYNKITNSSNALSVKGSKITKPGVSQASGSGRGSSRKSHRKSWVSRLFSFIGSKGNDENIADQPDLEGTTFIGENTPDKYSLLNKSAVKKLTPTSFLKLEGDTTLIDDDTSITSEDESSDGKEGQTNIKDLYRGWTEDEVWLFEKLDWRGYEPLLPKNWAADFLTMYELLFTNDDSIAFIKSASGKDYHAIKALRGLVKLSGHVRDRVQFGLSPEETIQREIESYFRWSMQDAGLIKTEHIPAIAIAAALPQESVASVVGRITDQLHHMGNQYRSLWLDRARSTRTDDVVYYTHDLPTLYGVVIKYSVVSLVTYDVAKPGQAVRCLGTYNLQKEGQDIWHALAISIIFIRARDYLMELKEEGQLGDEVDDDSTDEDA